MLSLSLSLYMIKKVILACTMLFLVAATACDIVEELLTFYIEEEETIVVRSNFPLGLVALDPITVTTNSNETFKNNKTRADLVRNVSLQKLGLTISEPAGENFDFLNSIEIYISSDGNGEDKLAYLENIPKGLTQLNLTTTNAKLDKHIKAEKYTLRTAAKLSKSVQRDILIDAAMRFKVTADPI